MKAIGYIIVIVALLGLVCAALALEQVAFIIRRTDKIAKQEKVEVMLLDLWGREDTADNRAWVDSGWQAFTNDATGETNLMYNVSMKQTGGRATPERITKWLTDLGLASNRVTKADTANIYDELKKKGWEPEKEKDPTSLAERDN